MICMCHVLSTEVKAPNLFMLNIQSGFSRVLRQGFVCLYLFMSGAQGSNPVHLLCRVRIHVPNRAFVDRACKLLVYFIVHLTVGSFVN